LDLAISDYSVALELDMRNGGNGDGDNKRGEIEEGNDYGDEDEGQEDFYDNEQ
jgi:hypothetical protein